MNNNLILYEEFLQLISVSLKENKVQITINKAEDLDNIIAQLKSSNDSSTDNVYKNFPSFFDIDENLHIENTFQDIFFEDNNINRNDTDDDFKDRIFQ